MKSLKPENRDPAGEQESLRRIEAFIARVLFWGGLVSIGIASAGLAVYIAHGSLDSGIIEQLAGQTSAHAAPFASVRELTAASLNFSDPLAITGFGLLLLLMLPVVTVALLVPAFLREKDYRYSAIAGAVLFILFLAYMFGAS